MANLDDLINDPKFGKLYASNYGFRTAANRLIGNLPGLENIFPTLQIGTNDQQELTYSLLNRQKPVARAAGQSNLEYLISAIDEAYGPVTRQRTTETRTGAAGNRRLQFLEKEHGVKFDIQSYSMKGEHAADNIAGMIGGDKGLVVVDSKTSTIARMEEGGRYTDMNRIFQIFGIEVQTEGAPFKRLKAFFNEAEAETVYDAAKRKVSVAVYDPGDYFGKTDIQLMETLKTMGTKAYDEQVAALIKQGRNVQEASKEAKAAAQFVEESLENLADGSMLMSESSFNRMLGQMNQAKIVMQKELDKSAIPPNSRAYLKRAKEIEDIERKIKSAKLNAKNGISTMGRIFNAKVFGTDESLAFMKAEVTIIKDDEFVKLNQQMNSSLTRKQILTDIDYMSMSGNAKVDEFTLLKGKDAPRFSFAMHNFNPKPDTAFSNPLTSATFSGFLDTNGYLNKSLVRAIDKDMEAVSEGRIPQGLHNMLDEIIGTADEGLTASERARLRDSQEFANRIKTFLANGGDLKQDPFLVKQFQNQIQEHYFRLAKQGGEYTIDGVTQTAYNGRFPMEGSTLAHLESTEFTRRKTPMGVLRIDHTRGRFGMSGYDIKAVREALGGFDMDDTIQSIYAYDKETKRLLVKVFRDPNQMGEFYLFDADITHDANLPWAIREEYRKHNLLLKEIHEIDDTPGPGTAKAAAIREKLQQLNGHKKVLNDYFSGKNVELENKLGVRKVYGQDFVQDISPEALYRNGMPAPTSSKFNVAGYKKGSMVRSFQEIQLKKVFDISKGIAVERDDMMNGRFTGGVFQYMYEGYSEYNDKYFKMIKPEDDIDPATGVIRKVKKLAFDKDFVDSAIRNAQKNNTVLGRSINQFTVIDEFIGSHLDFFGENNVDPRMKQKLEEILSEKNLLRIERETLIDALVKGEVGKEEVVEQIKNSLGGNMETLGRIIKDLDTFAEANNIAFKAGIDPTTFASRMARDEEQVAALERGYGGKGYLLADTDIKARETNRQRQIRETLGLFKEKRTVEMEKVEENLSQTLGKDFTPAQIERARLLINDIETAKIAARQIEESQFIEHALESTKIDETTGKIIEDAQFRKLMDLGRATSDEGIHIRTIAQMQNMKQSDILAIARVLLDSGGDLGILNQATPLPGSKQTVQSIYQRALRQDETLGRMAQVTTDYQLDEFIQYDAAAKTYKYSDEANMLIDTQARRTTMLTAWEKAEQDRFFYASGKMWAPDTPMPLMPAEQFYGMKEFIEKEHGQEGVSVAKRWGQAANRMRTLSDETLEGVMDNTGREFGSTIKRLGMESLRTSKGVRNGLIAVGLFAALGIGHRILKGDRDVSAANPYPLIPQDSKYESILENRDINMTQGDGLGGAVRYKIQAHNIPDVKVLSTSLQGVLPNGSATIYNSNAYQLSNANSDSRSILRERLGQS